jgi:hypothetical protein
MNGSKQLLIEIYLCIFENTLPNIKIFIKIFKKAGKIRKTEGQKKTSKSRRDARSARDVLSNDILFNVIFAAGCIKMFPTSFYVECISA